MSDDLVVADEEMLFLNGQDEVIDIVDGNMNGEPKSAEELSAIRARVLEMEEEAAKLKLLQNQVDHQMVGGGPSVAGSNAAASVNTGSVQPAQTASSANIPSPQNTIESKAEVDLRSIYVGNVDYGATAEELEAHFHGCGSINRVTILCNKYDGHPKGFAYIEFADKDSVQTAMAMDESLFRGRQIKVSPKRTNRPGLSTTNRGPVSRGRGFRGGRPFRGAGATYMYSGYRPMRRGRGIRRASYFPY